jgi:hypothetical protein
MNPARAIGGYFGLEPGAGRGLPWRADALAVQSGRMALRLALAAWPRATLWLPAWYCPPAREALAASGWTLRDYALDEDLGPDAAVQPAAGDRVLLVDWFGLCGAAVRRACRRFGADRVLIDAAMALWFEPEPGVVAACSPRKFVGVPDGGWLRNPPVAAVPPRPDPEATIARCAHLLRRAAGDIAGGRSRFAAAEAAIAAEALPTAMSPLTAQLLAGIDFDAVAAARRRNYRRLADGVAALGHVPPPLPDDAVPLCLPLPVPRAAALRRRLAEGGVYCAHYWDDVPSALPDPVGRRLREGTVCLPCDQRLGDVDVDVVVRALDAERAAA